MNHEINITNNKRSSFITAAAIVFCAVTTGCAVEPHADCFDDCVEVEPASSEGPDLGRKDDDMVGAAKPSTDVAPAVGARIAALHDATLCYLDEIDHGECGERVTRYIAEAHEGLTAEEIKWVLLSNDLRDSAPLTPDQEDMISKAEASRELRLQVISAEQDNALYYPAE